MKKGLLSVAAFLFPFSLAQAASPFQAVRVQRINEQGDIQEFLAKTSSRKDCNEVSFSDPSLTRGRYQINLIQGSAKLSRETSDSIQVCLDSDSAIYEAKSDSPKSLFHYSIQTKKAPEQVNRSSFVPFRILFGPTYEHYQNQYQAPYQGLVNNWSGAQMRVLLDGRIPVVLFGPSILHASFYFDFLNANLTKRYQAILTYQKKISGNDDHNWIVGIGTNGITTSGDEPYGIQNSASPIVEVEYNTKDSFSLSAYYSPFLGRTIELGSSEYEAMLSYPIRLFKHSARLALQYETTSISPEVSQENVAFSNYGFMFLIGFNFGDTQ